jgi:hypothetical protein
MQQYAIPVHMAGAYIGVVILYKTPYLAGIVKLLLQGRSLSEYTMTKSTSQ